MRVGVGRGGEERMGGSLLVVVFNAYGGEKVCCLMMVLS